MKIALLFLSLFSVHAAADSIPNRAKRIYALEQAGLLEEVSELDELDQDLLYMRAQNKSLADLQQAYPKLSKSKLGALQVSVRARK